jgi:phosphoglucomutase
MHYETLKNNSNMENKELLKQVREKAREWLSETYDEETRQDVQRMLDAEDTTELIDSFYKNLEFGTGGLRGIMGAGTNRVNKYTIGAANQGLSNYLKKNFADLQQIKVAIGHDCRNNSRFFAESSAKVFAANGIKAYLFEDLRPTPELSFAIRELGCQSGIILTASHNPKEYNGYKAYWDDGSQIVAPHDVNIVNEVSKVKIEDIKFDGPDHLVEIMGAEMDEKYLEMVKTVSISPDIVRKHHDIKIVFTPIHGTTVKMVPAALRKFGFTNIINVPEQDVVSGDFPTVISPNPEDEAAMEMAMQKAYETDADLVMASDPDGDRLGVAVKNDKGKYIIVNGNQTALIFIYYIITKMKEAGRLRGNEYVVKTIVSTELIAEIARKNNIGIYDVYTGFKFIAEIIREQEGKQKYIGGGEESFGFLPSDFVRDKDAVSSCALMAEITAWAIDQGKTLYELLQDIYLEYGYSKEKMISVVRPGKSGADEIQKMMNEFRLQPPRELGGSALEWVKDYSTLVAKNLISGEEEVINQKITSNVLQFFTKDGTKISVRPSGTEPKIKFYVEVKGELESREMFDNAEKKADTKIDGIMKQLGL